MGGNIGYQVQESAKSARFRLTTKQDNVSGVLLPRYESRITEGNKDFGLTGLGKGGQQVQKCRETYARAVESLVELATLQVRGSTSIPTHYSRRLTMSQTAFLLLDEVIKMVKRRGRSRRTCLLSMVLALTWFIVNAMYYNLHMDAESSTSLTCRTASTSSSPRRRTPSHVRIRWALSHCRPSILT